MKTEKFKVIQFIRELLVLIDKQMDNFPKKDIELKTGANFVVALAGKIMTMPGLPKVPAAENIDIDENEEIIGIF